MIIDVLCNDGSPLGITMKTLMGTDPLQVGCGGAEAALLTMCEAWHNRGEIVKLFNDPRETNVSSFEQRSVASFDPNADRDILIIFRSPNLRVIGAKGLKCWWSCDQFTIGNYKDYRPFVDKVVCISPFHVKYFKDNYGIEDAISIDLPVRVQDYENLEIEKIKNRFIFNSVPARGLHIFLDVWKKIVAEVPDATLVITSDYRLWSASLGGGNEQFIAQALPLQNITYLGAIPRTRLVEEELKAEIHAYSGIYEELFCIAVAETQVAGAYPITTNFGALPTTNMGTIFEGDVRDGNSKRAFTDLVINVCNNREQMKKDSEIIRSKAITRFHPNIILSQWEERVFKNG